MNRAATYKRRKVMKTTEIYFEELGYMTANQCEVIKTVMEGQTFMSFHVSYSNCCGNCTLICSTEYEATETEIRNFFLSALIGKMAMRNK